MSQGITTAATDASAAVTNNVGPDLLAYQNYFSFTPLSNDAEKRKSLIQSCAHCQKALLTCDGGRPCQGCIKRDLATTCSDTTMLRKKVKLNSSHDITSPTTTTPTTTTTTSTSSTSATEEIFSPTTSVPFTPADQPIENSATSYIDTTQLFNFSLSDLGFGSETTGLEYGILGNMTVDTPTTTTTTTTTTNDSKSYHHHQHHHQSLQQALFPFASPTSPLPQQHNSLQQQQQLIQQQIQQQQQQVYPQQQQQKRTDFSPPVQLANTMKRDSTSSTSSNTSSMTKLTTNSNNNNNNNSRRKGNNGNTPEAVYNSVRRPFNYAEGFHYLIQYVTDKMGREDLMRISKALSLFRPSFLSLIMNLTEEDLVFMERCIQRTLLEYEKLISFSGTPTVVWRRTGEVCLVGKEFSLLTQWSRDMLLNKKTYIYELMENQSAVEYWEKFSTHAFDNTDKACSYSCILRTPQQKPVPCTFCFTIKRDIFDLPSVIVGNFLPILS